MIFSRPRACVLPMPSFARPPITGLRLSELLDQASRACAVSFPLTSWGMKIDAARIRRETAVTIPEVQAIEE
jgi:hypothetical protein